MVASNLAHRSWGLPPPIMGKLAQLIVGHIVLYA